MTVPTRTTSTPGAGRTFSRRAMIRFGLAGAGAVVVVPRVPAHAKSPVVVGDGPYGPLLPPDDLGLMLPEGFRARVVAVSGRPVGETGYDWHTFPDGAATFATGDGGWIYVSNSEVPGPGGGVGAVRFDAGGEVADAYRLLEGTDRNCAGGATPWDTWLSCEESERGRVWEVDPRGAAEPQPRDAMGVFVHEAAAVDDRRGHVYLTEDAPDGLLYRFRPDAYPDLSSGVLEAMVVGTPGSPPSSSGGELAGASWAPVPDPSAASGATRTQVAEAFRFAGGEGMWLDGDRLFFTTKGDDRVWRHDIDAGTLTVVYEPAMVGEPALLTGVDNLVGTPRGDLVVAEDTGANELDLVLVTSDGELAPLVRVVGQEGSELTGPAFSPDGRRLYFSSQRGGLDADGRPVGGQAGITFEVTGPFGGPSGPTTSTAVATTAATGTTGTTGTGSTTVPHSGTTAGGAAAGDAGDGDDGGVPVVPIGIVGAAAAAIGATLWLRRRPAPPA